MKLVNNKIKLVVWDLDDTFWKGLYTNQDLGFINNSNIIINNSVYTQI
jgi:hypothetical protein